ncbi:MAG: DUF5391 family protein [Bacillota bacterium]|uniref:DUF5391 family protein n=1 Tax=Virgibacillus salarius TaxID=447199 RepID=A0A941DZR3_9BACI|nr:MULTISPECIES: DUF5391 family protein [Virgibacillus]MBR7798342.1 DUF5391 family protein [Virgibacillus salarius]MDY7044469.1 DUF5391 family protein [Virgibacillus sp. M23]NAZ11051.1 hypothetical protein [Agaribacter marinus]WBX80612.1 DUF5391 family protein [Virgibacillus salarius]
MLKKFYMVFLTLLIAVGAVLLAARYPTGPNTVSYDEPAGLWISIGIIIVLFLPPLLLSLFSNRVVRNISAMYQAFIVISFLGIIPVGFLSPNNLGLSAIAILGVVVSIASIIVTLKIKSNKKAKF